MLSYSEKEEKTTPFHAQGMFPKPLGKRGFSAKNSLAAGSYVGLYMEGKRRWDERA
jgi:hypothetical protein